MLSLFGLPLHTNDVNSLDLAIELDPVRLTSETTNLYIDTGLKFCSVKNFSIEALCLVISDRLRAYYLRSYHNVITGHTSSNTGLYRIICRNCILCLILSNSVCTYWDVGTTTVASIREYIQPRASRFIWPRTQSDELSSFFPWWDWYELRFRRRLFVVAGVSHEFVNLGTAAILNRRTLITSANYLDAYMDRQTELRIWALGRRGKENTPFRYRVWRVTRIFPKSINPEHCHGPFCYHCPRHDVAIIHSLDQMYLYDYPPTTNHFAFRAILTEKYTELTKHYDELWFAGSGYENLRHIYENYRMLYTKVNVRLIVDCSIYLPKWWGKFICIMNSADYSGVQNGGGLFSLDLLVGVGSFEVRYNEDKIFAFTDLRYYVDWVKYHGDIYPGEYYEYAYPQWGVRMAWVHDESFVNFPYVPKWQVETDLYPLGKK